MGNTCSKRVFGRRKRTVSWEAYCKDPQGSTGSSIMTIPKALAEKSTKYVTRAFRHRFPTIVCNYTPGSEPSWKCIEDQCSQWIYEYLLDVHHMGPTEARRVANEFKEDFVEGTETIPVTVTYRYSDYRGHFKISASQYTIESEYWVHNV